MCRIAKSFHQCLSEQGSGHPLGGEDKLRVRGGECDFIRSLVGPSLRMERPMGAKVTHFCQGETS